MVRTRLRSIVVCCTVSVSLAAPAAAQSPRTDSPSTAPRAVAPSVDSIVTDTLSDFSNLASWQTIAILAAGGAGAAVAHTADRPISRSLSGSAGMGNFLQAGETVGSARMQLAAAIATYAAGRAFRTDRGAALGADLIRAQLVTQTLTAGIKLSVGRTRPDDTGYSFPSGHASTSFATATVVQRHFGWKGGIPAYAMATYVAASRVQDKRHFLSDVTFGAALGIVAGRTVTVGRGKATFAVAPAPTAGGAAVNFTLLSH
jgi:membrane-associated phospholipid phosphatase